MAWQRPDAETARRDVELVAPKVGGITASDGSAWPGDQRVDGGPSVLYDAVAIVLDEDGAAKLSELPAARDFVNDAFAHCKFVAHTTAATALFEAVGLAAKADGGFVELTDASSVAGFLEACAALRFWEREATFA